jgi:hypothetical protein
MASVGRELSVDLSDRERRSMEELDDDRASAVSEVLESYAWRTFSPDVLARMVLAARDRHRVQALLGELTGTVAGSWQDLTPVEPDDIRVAPLTEFLGSLPWRGMPMASLVTEILGALHTWWFRWQWRLGDEDVRPADEGA